MDTATLLWKVLPVESLNTLYMVVVATFFSCLIGGSLGGWIYLKGRGVRLFSPLLDLSRSLPFAILMIAALPLTRLIVGTSVGTSAAIVPLTLAMIPSVARMVETTFSEVDPAVVRAARIIGASRWQLIWKVLLPESLPVLWVILTQTAIQLVGYSAMAGLIGGGGLGKVAIQYGYQRFNPWVIVVTALVTVCLVQGFQWGGNFLSNRIKQKRGLA